MDLNKEIEALDLPIMSSINENVFKATILFFEPFLLLFNEREAFSLYVVLIYLEHLKILNLYSQNDIIKALNFSKPTYIENRKRLEDLGLIEITYQHGKRNEIKILKLKTIESIEFTRTESAFETLKKAQALYKNNVLKLVQTEQTKNVDVEVKKRVAEELQKRKEAEKKAELKFPNEDYEIVTTAYKKYKGIGLIGPEIVRARRAIKQMFLAKRSIKEIIDFMRWLKENELNEEQKWVRTWTIETVMKKIPEFIGGKLTTKKMGDDLEYIRVGKK